VARVRATPESRKVHPAFRDQSTAACWKHADNGRILEGLDFVSEASSDPHRQGTNDERNDAVISLRGGRRASARAALARGWGGAWSQIYIEPERQLADVELQATTEPHCSRGVQPGGICVYVGAARAASRGPGAGLAPRPQALPIPAAALVLYIQFLA
jgi:hypothetical protein